MNPTEIIFYAIILAMIFFTLCFAIAEIAVCFKKENTEPDRAMLIIDNL